jgi:hypothetical protein
LTGSWWRRTDALVCTHALVCDERSHRSCVFDGSSGTLVDERAEGTCRLLHPFTDRIDLLLEAQHDHASAHHVHKSTVSLLTGAAAANVNDEGRRKNCQNEGVALNLAHDDFTFLKYFFVRKIQFLDSTATSSD